MDFQSLRPKIFKNFHFYMQKSKIVKIKKSKNFWSMFQISISKCFLPKMPLKWSQIPMKKIWWDSLIFFTSIHRDFRTLYCVKFREKGVQKMWIFTNFWFFRSKVWFFCSDSASSFWRIFNFIQDFTKIISFPKKGLYDP